MTHIELRPRDSWSTDRPIGMPIEVLKEYTIVRCSGCDELIEPEVVGDGLVYTCKNCSFCKQCGAPMEERFASDSPDCSEKVWVCSRCGVRK